MIISASRRTDLPAYYSEWLRNRIAAGFVLVRNPFSAHQVSRISLDPEHVDGIVFWSKNPAPMLDCLEEFREYSYYFQFTLNAYGREVEPELPSLEERIQTFLRLSDMIGSERVLWRYDPVLINQVYTMDWHRKQFRFLCSQLAGATSLCTFSFLDFYRKIAGKIRPLQPVPWTDDLQLETAKMLAETAAVYGIPLVSCAETGDFSSVGVRHGCCIDTARLNVRYRKDKNQRPACGCCQSVDIGRYNTCRNGCLYCYASQSPARIAAECARYRPDSPLLCSEPDGNDRITERKG